MAQLFDPIRIGGKALVNRIAVSPMCQFAATDGVAGAWHMQHLGSLALSGAGLLILESSAISEQCRISKGCLGIYQDQHMESLKRLVSDLKSFSDVALGIQLAHAGRKGSVRLPWEGESSLSPTRARGRRSGHRPSRSAVAQLRAWPRPPISKPSSTIMWRQPNGPLRLVSR